MGAAPGVVVGGGDVANPFTSGAGGACGAGEKRMTKERQRAEKQRDYAHLTPAHFLPFHVLHVSLHLRLTQELAPELPL